MQAETQYPPIGELIPHGEAITLLDEMVRWAPGDGECSVTIAEDAPFVANGVVDIAVAIEYMAQAVAACLGYHAFRGGGDVRVGMIIACRSFTAHESELPIGQALSVTAHQTRGNESLSHFECAIRRRNDDSVLAEAMLTLYHAAAPPED